MTQIQQYVREYVALVPEGALRNWAKEFFSPARLRRCHAKSRKTFSQWVQMQLAREPEYQELADYFVKALLVEPEVVKTTDERGHDQNYDIEVNEAEGLAFIKVSEIPLLVWRLPLDKLAWAKALLPVTVKEKDSPLSRELRAVQHELANTSSESTKQELVSKLAELEIEKVKERKRYVLTKRLNGSIVPLHRLYIETFVRPDLALYGLDVAANDGDYLNFSKSRFEEVHVPIFENGIAWTVSVATKESLIDNLLVVSAKDFAMWEDEGDIVSPERDSKGCAVVPVGENQDFYSGIVARCQGEAPPKPKAVPVSSDDRRITTDYSCGVVPRNWNATLRTPSAVQEGENA